jgi:hypothetical protein
MNLELVHASVGRGLRGGSGFSTVVATAGMPVELEAILAELSAYDFDPGRAMGADEVDWSHRIVSVQGRTHTVLARVAPCGVDQSGRGNRVAHHLVVDVPQRCEGGPAWMLSRFVAFARTPPAPSEPRLGPTLPAGALPARRASAWEALGLDPGWAGVVARAVLDSPTAPVYLVFPESGPLLEAMCDVSALLPVERRWFFTFTTRYQKSHGAAKCQVRCVRAGAQGVSMLQAEPGAKVLRLGGAPIGDQAAIEAGREGKPLVSAFVSSRTQVPAASHSAQPSARPSFDPDSAKPASSRPPAEPIGPKLTAPTSSLTDPEPAVHRAQSDLPAVAPGLLVPAPESWVDWTRPVGESRRSAPTRSEWMDPIVLGLFVYSLIALILATTLFLLD